MKKVLKIKTKYLNEAIDWQDFSDPQIKRKLASRKNEIIRLAKLATEKANQARKENKSAEAIKLDNLAQELYDLAQSGKFNTEDNEPDTPKDSSISPSEPVEPDKSEEPEGADKSDKPEKADKPAEPVMPEKPEEPGESEEPDEEEKEEKPEELNKSEESEKSEEPGESEKSDKEEKEEKPEEPPANPPEPTFDPFEKQKLKLPIMPSQPTQELTKDQVLKAALKRLQQLEGQGKAGAIAGLTNLLKDKSDQYGLATQTEQFVREDYKNKITKQSIDELNDDEFADLVNNILDDVNKIMPIKIDPPKDPTQIKEIQNDLNDPNFKKSLDIEDNISLQKDFQKKRAQQDEIRRYTSYKSIPQFKIDFYYTIKDQVAKYEDDEESWASFDRRNDDKKLIKKGYVYDDKLRPDSKPSVDLYFDMSGSWTQDSKAMDIGKQTVATLKEFVDRDEIDLNVYYFSNADRDGFATDPTDSRLGGNTYAWTAILQNIKANNTKNVVIMTDCDMEGEAKYAGLNCVVDGCVWYLWNLNYSSSGCKSLYDHLKGKQGTFQYSFKSN